MKTAKLSLAILGSILSLSSLANAQDKGTLVLDEPVSVHNTVLKPGTYTVEWNAKDSSTEVRFAQGKKTIAVAHGTIVKGQSANGNSGFQSMAQSGGGKSMTAYLPESKKYKISLDDEEAAK